MLILTHRVAHGMSELTKEQKLNVDVSVKKTQKNATIIELERKKLSEKKLVLKKTKPRRTFSKKHIADILAENKTDAELKATKQTCAHKKTFDCLKICNIHTRPLMSFAMLNAGAKRVTNKIKNMASKSRAPKSFACSIKTRPVFMLYPRSAMLKILEN